MQQHPDIVWQSSPISRQARAQANQHQSAIVWFTGLSGAGKTTMAYAVEQALFEQGCQAFVLDGDNMRHGLCNDLAFSSTDRAENIRRVGEVAKLFMEAGVIVLTAFISPFQADRQKIRERVGANNFIEVYCNTPIHICEQRDVKGLYAKARSGQLKEFTGISSPYEAPRQPEVMLETGIKSIGDCVTEILALLESRKVILK